MKESKNFELIENYIKAMEKFIIAALKQNSEKEDVGRELWMLLPPAWKSKAITSVAYNNSFIEDDEAQEQETFDEMDCSYCSHDSDDELMTDDNTESIMETLTVFAAKMESRMDLEEFIKTALEYIEFDDEYQDSEDLEYERYLEKGRALWNMLPSEMKATGDIAYVAYERDFIDDEERYSSELWMIFAEQEDNFDRYFDDLFPIPKYVHISSNPDIMLKAIVNDGRTAKCVYGPLRTDASFWEMLLEKHPQVIIFIEKDVMNNFPQLIRNTLLKKSFNVFMNNAYVCYEYYYDRVNDFANDLMDMNVDDFRSPSFTTTWLELGLPLIENSGEDYQERLQHLQRQNRSAGIYLMVTKHCQIPHLQEESFSELPTELKSNKEFFNNVIAVNPKLIYYASKELKRDIDFTALAFSKSGNALNFVNLAQMTERKLKFEKLLKIYEAYHVFQMYLKDHTSKKNIDHHCPIARLPKDESFIQRLDKDIASYVDVPNMTNMNMKLQVLRSAIRNMNDMEFLFST